MDLTSFTEWKTTREKLQKLETLYADQEKTPAQNSFVREVSQRSLKRIILQLREEIARFEAKAYFSNPAGPSKLPEPSVPDAS